MFAAKNPYIHLIVAVHGVGHYSLFEQPGSVKYFSVSFVGVEGAYEFNFVFGLRYMRLNTNTMLQSKLAKAVQKSIGAGGDETGSYDWIDKPLLGTFASKDILDKLLS